MQNALRQLAALAKTTAAEGLRQPAALLVALSFYYATVLTPFFQAFQFGEPGRMVRDGGLAFMLLAGIALSVCTAAATVRREIAGGAAAAALTRPLSRGRFLCGKFCGVAGVLLLFSLFALAVILMAERVSERFRVEAAFMGYVMDARLAIGLLGMPPAALAFAGVRHFRRRGHFCTTAFAGMLAGLALLLAYCGGFNPAGHWQGRFAPHLNLPVAGAALLILLALWLLAALAVALATRLEMMPVLALCAATVALGLVADPVLGIHPPFSPLGLLTALAPNLQHFWLNDALAGGGAIPVAYLWSAFRYTACWVLLALLAGAGALQTREIA